MEKIYTAKMAAKAYADEIRKGKRWSEDINIVVAEGIEKIDDYAFDNLFMMYISLPSTLKEIGKFAFRNTNIYMNTLPDGLEKIGEGAFYNTGIKDITIPSSVNEIGANAFENSLHYDDNGNVRIFFEKYPNLNDIKDNCFSFKNGTVEITEPIEKSHMKTPPVYTVNLNWTIGNEQGEEE